MFRWTFTKGDIKKPLKAECFDQQTGVVDISGSTVAFRYWINGTAYEKLLTITDGPNGLAESPWTTLQQVAWIAGTWPCQIKITGGDSLIRYLPSEGQYGQLTIKLPI